MLALRFYDQRDIRLEEIPKPSPKPHEVLIRVSAAGLSQTQINEFVEGPFVINKTPHPLTKKATPLIPSQEFGGVVVEVGEDVDPSLIGKQVAVLPLIACGSCEYCKDRKEQLCDQMAYHGLVGADGGFCEYSCVAASNLFFVEKSQLLTFIEPILVALHAGSRYESFAPLTNKKVLVLGAGVVGICVAAIFRDYFKADVTINDILPGRLQRAKQAGLETIPKRKITKKYDLVVDAAGMDTLIDRPAIIEGFSYLKNGSFLLDIGSYFHPISFTPASLLVKEQSILKSMAYNSQDVQRLQEALDALTIDFTPLIEYIELRNIIEDGYFRAEIDKDSFTHIVVKP